MADDIRIKLEIVNSGAIKAVAETEKSLGKFQSTSDKTAKGVSKNFKDLGEAGKDSANSISFSFQGASRAVDTFKGVVGAQLLVGAFNTIASAAGSLFNTFVVDGIAAAAAQEEATNKLNVALQLTGIYSAQTSKDLQEYANSIQSTTKYEDDLVLETAALIQNLGALDKDGLKRATTAALDLSAALGIDLNSAATLVGKAANGQIETFGRYGVQIKKGATDAETFANALEVLEGKFGGAAAKQVQTFSGGVAQLSNLFGDLQETIGGVITQNPVILKVFGEFANLLKTVTSSVEGNNEGLKQFVGQGVVLTIQGFEALAVAADAVYRPLKAMTNGILLVFNAAAAGVAKLAGDTEGAAKIWEQALQDGSDVLDAFDNKTFLSQTAESLTKLKTAAEEGYASLSSNSDTAATNVETNSARVIQAETEKNQKLIDLQNELTISTEEARLTKLQNEDLQKEEGYARLEEQLGREAAIRRLAEERSAQDSVKTEELRLQTQIDFNKRSVKAAADKVENEKKLEKERSENFKSTLGTISTLQRSNNKALFAAGKAAAIAQAGIDGYAAVQKALASAPPPFNFVLAALVGAATAQNVARIAATQPPAFEQGGIVPGNSFTGDKVSARVNSGEMILNRQQQSNLFNQINSGGGDSKTVALLSGILSAVERNLVIQIDGREVINVVRSELNGGRSFA